ncbi:oxygen-independent coproporphyrinogen III oxidase [Biformimicrobium ophioploci]|uniref:Coproporphyrinogen-III oxidase n=1 Tax=Biformimicrobium ophioploci TaxID=3036711 RepID=A0ABQ6M028_9GAMM|nr:oxygen-independent coproporphyrinogen III oxidase [Microbulbifer sp. NKW57]GMG87700.1 oxygen-independent coproporphyrinogen III oxidase [Microbulbifer sp. NKW57]
MTAATQCEARDLTPELLARYSGPCPRYTSYPTADRFGPIGGLHPWDALRDVKTLSLYVHIPFCHSLCYFCACNKVITNQYGLASSYLDVLLEEARWYKDKVADAPVIQLHLGGGTPTFLNDTDLRRMVEGLSGIFNLTPGKDVEYSIEADPRTLRIETLDTLRELGFNRLSKGIQDFNPQVQKAINRLCGADQVAALTSAARDKGFNSISYDLIYGLPHQTVASLERTIERVIELAPDRIALYHYAHLPHRFKAQRLIDTDATPSAADKIDMQLAAVAALEAAGFESLGMDHFARPDDELCRAAREGALKRNFQGYTVMPADALVGLGASAISYTSDGFWQNQHKVKEYVAAVKETGSAAFRGWTLDADDRLRQHIVMELMCRMALDKAEISAMVRAPFDAYFAPELARLAPMVADGLVQDDAASLRITPRGRWFARNVASAFDAHLHAGENQTRYSRVL